MVKVSDHAALEEAFGKAEPEHFAWQTSSPFVAERERDLVRAAFLPLGDRVLDVGCGEGATLMHLDGPRGATGVDLFEEKLAFARQKLKECKFEIGSATALPFPDASFDHVIVRDLIHHVEDAAAVARECHRVLVKGGRVDVLEPCGRNPLIALHALTTPVERGELRSTERFLTSLFSSDFDIERIDRYQALPIHRLVFHPKLGAPDLGSRALVRLLVDGFERVAERVIPRAAWAYIHIRARAR